MKTILPWMMLARGSKCFYQGTEFTRGARSAGHLRPRSSNQYYEYNVGKSENDLCCLGRKVLSEEKSSRIGRYSDALKRVMGGYPIIKVIMFNFKF